MAAWFERMILQLRRVARLRRCEVRALEAGVRGLVVGFGAVPVVVVVAVAVAVAVGVVADAKPEQRICEVNASTSSRTRACTWRCVL